MKPRQTKINRKTKETQIELYLCIDGNQKYDIKTGIPFFNHMLEQLTFHSNFDLKLHCQGDLDVDSHHTIEDIGITIGIALHTILDNNHTGIERYSTIYLPMDETLTRTALDISGRPFHHFNGNFLSPTVNNFPTQITEHFFYAFAINAKITLHQEIIYAKNDHHIIESLFKGLAITLKKALSPSLLKSSSTKNYF